MPNFVFDGVVAGGNTTALTPNNWLRQQSYFIDQPSVNVIPIRFVPDSGYDTYSVPFNFTGTSFDNTDASKNFVVRLGHNIDNGGGPGDVTRSTLQDEWEQHYLNSGVEVVERHLAFTPVGGSIQRFITFLGRSDGVAPSDASQNSVGIVCDRIYMANRTNVTEYFRVDAATGFIVKNLNVGLQVEQTASGNGLTLAAPAGGTGNFFQLSYNFSTFTYCNRYGEWSINGSGQAGTGAVNSMLRVQGRTGTPNLVQFDSIDGNQRFTVSGNGSDCIISTPTTYFKGSNLSVYDSGLTSLKFGVIAASGQIWTNQRAAATTIAAPGTVTGKLPIYDNAGTIQGYIPIYAAIT